ncbi:MAG: PspA/IM30 family protein [Merismopedia sp. SIO2A8]|nr:PspA/IM30 family protein [Symploca sp. SIO2B6]NET47864.1 PspA/IM30 family protein [Merismopedia sp. SIO2A8]
MGFLDRIGRAIKAGIKSVVDTTEDPEKVLEQTVMEMEDDLIRIRQAVAQAIATQKRTERQSNHAKQTADEWYRRAQLALQKNDDETAREALTRRKSYLDTARMLDLQRDQQRGMVKKLKANMLTLERQLAEAKTRKDMYIARVRSAKASQQLNEMLGGIGTRQSMTAFDRMEETVQELEAQSEAVAELTSGGDWERRFAALEKDSDVDSELATLKARINDTANQ